MAGTLYKISAACGLLFAHPQVCDYGTDDLSIFICESHVISEWQKADWRTMWKSTGENIHSSAIYDCSNQIRCDDMLKYCMGKIGW